MIWIDITDPKYAVFFSKMVPLWHKKGYKTLITTRYSEDYKEPSKILTLNGIKHKIIGKYGGISKRDKFLSRIERQKGFTELFEKEGYPKIHLSGASVEGIQTASALGIASVNFADTPLRNYIFNYDDITFVSRLTFALSTLIFRPFVIPQEIYVKAGVDPKKIKEYGFIDICLWMKEIKKDKTKDFRDRFDLDKNRYTVLVREEEFKANYVKEKLDILYDLTKKISKNIDANIVIMPRYESDHLYHLFGKDKNITILEEKIMPEEFYPFIDLLIGGGGTMNLEAAYMGIPTISTRSFLLFHDKYLIDNNLIKWTDDANKGLLFAKEMIGKRFDNKRFFCQDKCEFEKITKEIERLL